MNREELESLAKHIVNAAFEVHSTLGAGLLESCYELAFCHELTLHGISFERQKLISVAYKDLQIESGFRLDVLVADEIIVELKAVEALNSVHHAQTLTYLKLFQKPLAFLINFNTPSLKNNIKRYANTLPSF